METKEKTTRRLRPLLPLLPPVLLSLLFYLFRGRQALMDGWVIHVMAPAEQLLGRLSAPLPFSLAEVLVTVFLTACALCLIRGTVLAVRLHAPHELGRRLVCLLCALLWVWTGYCWLWSAGYYSASFAEKRSGDPALHRVHPGPGHAVLCLPGRRPLHPDGPRQRGPLR